MKSASRVLVGWVAASALAITVSTAIGGEPCDGNVNGDDAVTVEDLLEVVGNFGECDGPCSADLNDDEVVDVEDLLLVVQNFGACPGEEACQTPSDCDDDDPCTVDYCFQGECIHRPLPTPECD